MFVLKVSLSFIIIIESLLRNPIHIFSATSKYHQLLRSATCSGLSTTLLVLQNISRIKTNEFDNFQGIEEIEGIEEIHMVARNDRWTHNEQNIFDFSFFSAHMAINISILYLDVARVFVLSLLLF